MLLPTQKCYITSCTMKKSNLFSFFLNICKCFPDSSLLLNYVDILYVLVMNVELPCRKVGIKPLFDQK